MSFRTSFLQASVLFVALAGMVGASDVNSDWRDLITAGVRAGMAKKFPKAEECLLQAVQLAAKFPPNDARTGTTLNTLGLMYKEDKKYSDAEKAFRRALGIMEESDGAGSLNVGNVNFNLASVAISSGQYEGALPYIQKSQAIYQKILGPDSLKMTSVLCMEGEVYSNLKKFSEAEAPLKQCADKQEALGGLETPDAANALYNLGLVYEHEGKYALADTRLKMAEKIRELTAGVTSPEFAEALEAHAVLLRAMGRDNEAVKDEGLARAIRHNGNKTQ